LSGIVLRHASTLLRASLTPTIKINEDLLALPTVLATDLR
jgi:hypothetical protein